MEYNPEPTADATAPVITMSTTQPTSVEDLKQRLAVLKSMGVRQYVDGHVYILFERPQQRQSDEDPIAKLERLYHEAEQGRLANGG